MQYLFSGPLSRLEHKTNYKLRSMKLANWSSVVWTERRAALERRKPVLDH